MAANFLEMLAKIQNQTLENVKQLEAVQISTLATARELVASLPSMTSISTVPTLEGLPSLSQFAELNASFATQLLDQQKSYVNQLAELFTPAMKISAN